MQQIKDKIKAIMIDYGVEVNDEEKIEMDSIQYISVMVELESYFDIEFPDEYLVSDLFSSFENVIKAIGILMGEKYKDNNN